MGSETLQDTDLVYLVGCHFFKVDPSVTLRVKIRTKCDYLEVLVDIFYVDDPGRNRCALSVDLRMRNDTHSRIVSHPSSLCEIRDCI